MPWRQTRESGTDSIVRFLYIYFFFFKGRGGGRGLESARKGGEEGRELGREAFRCVSVESARGGGGGGGGGQRHSNEKDAYRYTFRWEKVPQSSKTLHGALSVDVLCFVLVFLFYAYPIRLSRRLWVSTIALRYKSH